MSLTIDQFIDAAANVGLLPAEVIVSLRSLVRESQGQAQTRHLAKWLVDNGHLTPFQAKELLSGNLKAAAAASPNDDLTLVEDEPLDVFADEPLDVIEEDDLEVIPNANATVAEGIKSPPDVRTAKPPPGSWASPTRPSAPPPSGPAPPPVARMGSSGFAPPNAAESWPAGSAASTQPFGNAMPPGGMPSGMPPQPGASQQFGGQSVRPVRLGKGKKKKKGAAWDSPLLMIGGGLLLGLVIFGLFLLWRISRGSSEEALKLAEDEYGKNSFSQAVHLYDQYLKNFPQDKNVSIARVHRGLAQMRLAVDGTSNWGKALATAKEILSEIETEPDFGQAEGELNSMLTRVADGLKERARLAPTRELVDQCQEALGLVRRYVPKAHQQAEKIQDIERSLALSIRELERTSRREVGLKQIQEAVAGGHPEQAYGIRDELLKTYPDLSVDQGLQEAIVSASQAERDKVVFVEEQAAAQSGDLSSPWTGEIILAPRSGGAAEGVDAARVAFVLAEGAAYGLEAATGKVLWRRFVGFDTSYVPQATGAATGGDALLVDSLRNEVVRLEAATGAVKWRHPLGEPIVEGPLPLRNQALVALRSGKIMSLQLEDGSAANRVQLPQTVRTAPAADSRQRMCYQMGDRANLYVLSVETNRCEDVYYLGHGSGSVVISPVVMGPYLIVCENTGVSTGTLHVLLVNDAGLAPREVQKVTVDGHILTPPMAAGRNLLVVTDRGGFHAFEVNTPDQEPALVKVAEKGASENRSLVRHLLLRNAQFWVAENQLTKYDVQVVQGKLSPKWVKLERDVFVSRPQLAGDFLICSRRKPGVPGVAVSAVRTTDGSSAWDLQLAAPVVGGALVNSVSNKLSLVTSAGSLLQTELAPAKGQQVLDKAVASADAGEAALGRGRLTSWADGRAALTFDNPSPRYLFIDTESAKRLPWVKGRGTLTGMAVALGDSLLVATQEGPLQLVNPRTGAAAAEPFVPPLQAGSTPIWNALVATGDGHVLAADGTNKLYKLAIQESGTPHLSVIKEVDLAASITSPVAVADGLVYGIDAQDRLLTFQLDDLTRAGEQQLAGKVSWGPATVGGLVLLATEDGELQAFAGGKPGWRTTLNYGALAGLPLEHEGQLLLTATRAGQGTLYAVSPETGQEIGRLDVGRPLAGGPLLLGESLILAGQDGTQYIVPKDALPRAQQGASK